MSYGYLGTLGDVSLDTLKYYNGFFEITNPNVINTFNNYPDDSDILYKIIYNPNETVNALATIYGISADDVYRKISGTKEGFTYIQDKHKPVYGHLSGTAGKVITGMLEVKSSDDFCVQRFYRFTDNVNFIRTYIDGAWSTWGYEYAGNYDLEGNLSTTYLAAFADLAIPKKEIEIENLFREVLPPFDDTELQNAVNNKVDTSTFNEQSVFRNNAVAKNTLAIISNPMRSDDPRFPSETRISGSFILNNNNGGDNTPGTYVHAYHPRRNHYQQWFDVIPGNILRIGQVGYSGVALNSWMNHMGDSNVYWNDVNNPDCAFQLRRRFQYELFSGRWGSAEDKTYTDRLLSDMEDIQISTIRTGNIGEPGTTSKSFMLPTCTREDMDIYISGYSTGNRGIRDTDVETRICIRWIGNTGVRVIPVYVEYWAYFR